ncbi:Fumipyrrole biosynthesis protein C [Lachnellula occidentalis]|uniref:Fumipyrrole biosynthesis protein C n=1 Tax=Lachnellula occidentalis TaxID=215460 RepID=A0A8H8UAW7_9HELO|nr:Fumipyrrole biosynthesis protein C [Lachnellula occidentalis]
MAYKLIAKPLGGIEEASWKVSWKIIPRESTSKRQSFQSADVVFEKSSVPLDYVPQSSSDVRLFLESVEGGQREELQPTDLSHPKAFDFLLETLEATVSFPRAIKLVSPCDKGNIIHADILPKRMQDIDYIEKTTAFAHPLQLFTGEEWTASTAFATLFQSSVGAIRLNGTSTTTSQTTNAALDVLEDELKNRLPTMVVAGLTRRTVVLLEGQDTLPHRGGYAAQFYGAAELMGIDVVVLAAEGHWLQSGSEYGHWRKAFIPIEFGYDAEFPSRIVAAVRKYGERVDGIMTLFDCYQVVVSKAALELGLPTEPTSAYEVIGNKYETSVFEGRKSFKVTSYDEAMRIARTEDLSWPIIMKPCRGWASELVSKIDNIEQLATVRDSFGSSTKHGSEFVMEPFCNGPEVDINFVVYDGQVVFWEIGDENPKSAEDVSDNDFHEVDCCSPSALPATEQAILHDTIVASLTNLGFRHGLYHCEARVGDSTVEWRRLPSGAQELVPRSQPSARSPSSFLIEVNPRPPGINSSDIIETTWGVDYFSVLLAIRVRDAERVHALAQPYRDGAQYFANMIFVSAHFDGAKKGVWETGDMTEELIRRRPDLGRCISKHITYLRKGDRVPHPSTGVNTFVGYLNVFSRTSRAHVLEITAEVRRELRMEWS